MSSTVTLTTVMLEGQSGIYSVNITDENDDGILVAQFFTLTLTYYDELSGVIINTRDGQNALNTNNVTLAAAGSPLVTTLTWLLQPADTVLVDARHELEWHVALFQWTWDSGTKHMAREVRFAVENLLYG